MKDILLSFSCTFFIGTFLNINTFYTELHRNDFPRKHINYVNSLKLNFLWFMPRIQCPGWESSAIFNYQVPIPEFPTGHGQLSKNLHQKVSILEGHLFTGMVTFRRANSKGVRLSNKNIFDNGTRRAWLLHDSSPSGLQVLLLSGLLPVALYSGDSRESYKRYFKALWFHSVCLMDRIKCIPPAVQEWGQEG